MTEPPRELAGADELPPLPPLPPKVEDEALEVKPVVVPVIVFVEDTDPELEAPPAPPSPPDPEVATVAPVNPAVPPPKHLVSLELLLVKRSGLTFARPTPTATPPTAPARAAVTGAPVWPP